MLMFWQLDYILETSSFWQESDGTYAWIKYTDLKATKLDLSPAGILCFCDVTKIQTLKSQGLLRFYLQLIKDPLQINFCASFQRESFFRFENMALSNFPIGDREAVRYAKKNNFIAWYYALWMVKVLENVFREIICSFAVNNWSNLWR